MSAGAPPQTPLDLESLHSAPHTPSGFQGSPSIQTEEGKGKKGEGEGDKSPEWLSQKLGSTANAAVNS